MTKALGGTMFTTFRNNLNVVEPPFRLQETVKEGPTSFAPIIKASIDIVERSNGLYHVLVIIADGEVTEYANSASGSHSPQESATIDAIVSASQYPLSIILVGVGDGPWDKMQQFDDNILQKKFDNFQILWSKVSA
ncbi:E3 ubiquitin-protein ligase RGLG5-like [Nymphaea colorata]|nr:E3 ubiquitin-protein ligase RGLG5-like [Nymphaea colorata]